MKRVYRTAGVWPWRNTKWRTFTECLHYRPKPFEPYPHFDRAQFIHMCTTLESDGLIAWHHEAHYFVRLEGDQVVALENANYMTRAAVLEVTETKRWVQP